MQGMKLWHYHVPTKLWQKQEGKLLNLSYFLKEYEEISLRCRSPSRVDSDTSINTDIESASLVQDKDHLSRVPRGA